MIDKKDFDLLLKVRNAACHLAALSPYEEKRDVIHHLIGMFDKSGVDDPSGFPTSQKRGSSALSRSTVRTGLSWLWRR